MDALQARKLTTSFWNKNEKYYNALIKVHYYIEDAAKNGHSIYLLKADFDSDPLLIQEILQALKNKGFKVEYFHDLYCFEIKW